MNEKMAIIDTYVTSCRLFDVSDCVQISVRDEIVVIDWQLWYNLMDRYII